MATLVRPCYATREEVRRAADVQLASYSDARIDRQIQSASRDVDRLCGRNFMLNDTTVHFDWPNYQYAYPWRVWLDAAELADYTVNPPVVDSGGVIIPNSAIFYGDPNYPTPPFTYIELDRSQNYSFGNGPTPQREIAITGSFGYWRQTEPAGSLAVAMSDTTSTSVAVTDGHNPGVGDMMIVDSERMLVTDSSFSSLSVGFSSGITAAFPSDNVGTATVSLAKDEVIQVDSELMLVTQVGPQPNTYVVKRAWGGSVIATHGSDTIYARRMLTVQRGVKGSIAATHFDNAPISILSIPDSVKQLTVAYSIIGITQEVATYSSVQSSRTTGESALGRATPFAAVREQQPGSGIAILEERVLTSYGRRARSRVI
jgi:hypothetical protein